MAQRRAATRARKLEKMACVLDEDFVHDEFREELVSSSHHLSSAQASRAQSSMFSATSTNNKTRISPSAPRNQKTLPNPLTAVTKATPSIQVT
ncbi:hypothetical protein KIN20_029295 [Parelaphostrongylus tenuis]|uniref:Uncharacterized protein n=1 Tax=Parelaphostrongylus tenuis TaxID=148309 RepID=A0AAD5R275_PARTN|nr:hypothetical protein KIN20_029295 [Parelaphostrongylus tenuis]